MLLVSNLECDVDGRPLCSHTLAHRHPRLALWCLQSLKKATYKAAAFYKGLLLPLCASGTCNLREAVIFTSVIRRTSIPVLHSAAAMLRIAGAKGGRSRAGRVCRSYKHRTRCVLERQSPLPLPSPLHRRLACRFLSGRPMVLAPPPPPLSCPAEMPYSGTNSFFLRVLLDKKYALPYRVVSRLRVAVEGFCTGDDTLWASLRCCSAALLPPRAAPPAAWPALSTSWPSPPPPPHPPTHTPNPAPGGCAC